MTFYKNMFKIFLVIFVLTSLNWIFNSPVISMGKEKSEEQINKWIEQLNNKDWRDRSIGVAYLDQLNENQKTEKVKISLIKLLEKEIIIEKDGKHYIRTAIKTQSNEEGFTEYIIHLLEAVAKLRDERTAPIFIEYTTVGKELLPDIGESIIDPLIEKLNDRLDNVKDAFTGWTKPSGEFVWKNYIIHKIKDPCAIHILGEVVRLKEKGYVANGDIRKKIKDLLVSLLEEANHPADKSIEWHEAVAGSRANVRKEVIWALGNLGDADVILIIEKVAQEDPYFLDLSKKKNYTGPEKRYTVREEATKVLEQLERKVKEDTK